MGYLLSKRIEKKNEKAIYEISLDIEVTYNGVGEKSTFSDIKSELI